MGCTGLFNKTKVQGERRKAKGERRKAKGERRKAKGERRKAKGEKIARVPKLLLGNPDCEAPASRDRKLELPAPNSQAGAWELAINFFITAVEHVEIIKI
jgi:hypothetical protein